MAGPLATGLSSGMQIINPAAIRVAIVTLEMDEEGLVRAARRGDGAAFGQLVGRYSRAVLARQYG